MHSCLKKIAKYIILIFQLHFFLVNLLIVANVY